MPPDQVAALLRALTDFRSEVKDDIQHLHAEVKEDLDEIKTQVRKTNGRVTELEISRATERGAALQRAATIEDVRQTRASDLARNAWIRPGIVAVLVVVLDAAIKKLT